MLCFDRGGWSPGLFAHVIAAGFDLLTYRKAAAGKDAPALPDDTFATMAWTGDDGRAHEYDLAESSIELPVTSGEHKVKSSRCGRSPAATRAARCTS